MIALRFHFHRRSPKQKWDLTISINVRIKLMAIHNGNEVYDYRQWVGIDGNRVGDKWESVPKFDVIRY